MRLADKARRRDPCLFLRWAPIGGRVPAVYVLLWHAPLQRQSFEFFHQFQQHVRVSLDPGGTQGRFAGAVLVVG